eukprot:jgi/Botrbrau1/23022/Bobra.136_1s0013.1
MASVILCAIPVHLTEGVCCVVMLAFREVLPPGDTARPINEAMQLVNKIPARLLQDFSKLMVRHAKAMSSRFPGSQGTLRGLGTPTGLVGSGVPPSESQEPLLNPAQEEVPGNGRPKSGLKRPRPGSETVSGTTAKQATSVRLALAGPTHPELRMLVVEGVGRQLLCGEVPMDGSPTSGSPPASRDEWLDVLQKPAAAHLEPKVRRNLNQNLFQLPDQAAETNFGVKSVGSFAGSSFLPSGIALHGKPSEASPHTPLTTLSAWMSSTPTKWPMGESASADQVARAAPGVQGAGHGRILDVLLKIRGRDSLERPGLESLSALCGSVGPVSRVSFEGGGRVSARESLPRSVSGDSRSVLGWGLTDFRIGELDASEEDPVDFGSYPAPFAPGNTSHVHGAFEAAHVPGLPDSWDRGLQPPSWTRAAATPPAEGVIEKPKSFDFPPT